MWLKENQHATRTCAAQERFPANVWTSIVSYHRVSPYLMPEYPLNANYLVFLQPVFPQNFRNPGPVLHSLLQKNMTKNMADSDLALYINALLASCKDPTNFYGTNLVNILRYSVNSAQDDERFVSPAVYLTLSINNVTSKRDVRELQDFFSRQDDINNRLDIQALAMLAVSSAFNTNLIPAETYDSLKMKFLETLNSKNLLGNIYEAALTLQVLLELKLNETESKVSKLVDFLLRQQQPDGSFESILATYLVLPILSGQNLLKIGKWCDARPSTDLTPIEVLTNPGHQRKGLIYILKVGHPVEVSQTLQMQVPKNIHFLDVMRLAQDISPQYRPKHGVGRKTSGYIFHQAPKDIFHQATKHFNLRGRKELEMQSVVKDTQQPPQSQPARCEENYR
ncbi:uncharacterized protein NPIL_463051, partial [Nephila pilipes]